MWGRVWVILWVWLPGSPVSHAPRVCRVIRWWDDGVSPATSLVSLH